MGHANLYFSRPRTYGPGSRSCHREHRTRRVRAATSRSVCAPTTTVSSASTVSTCAVVASVSTPPILDSRSYTMDPVEAGDWLSQRPQQLILLTGLDPSNRPVHNALLASFSHRSHEKPPLRIRLVSELDLPGKDSTKKGKGILRKGWPRKYLDQVPALIVLFMDLDWDHPSWPEKLQEAGSKVESLRGSMRHGSKLVVVLIQDRYLPSMDDGISSERSSEFCHHCGLTTKQLFPVGGDIHNYVNKLEAAFHELAQGFYQNKIKTIRARSIPNNSPELHVRQLFKMAFLYELRQDTHTALRNYKLAYDQCRDTQEQWDSMDVFEWRSVLGLINYKMCELNFLHSTAREAITHMNRHQIAFFNSHPGTYPTPQLAAIEFALWKSKQCWQFAELFERAVGNGLTAVATINPGTFLDGAASHFIQANKLIAELKAQMPPNVQYPQPDPLEYVTEFFGQRPWKGTDAVPSVATEQSAVSALQQRLRINHDGVLSLLNAAMQQYKKYGCGRMQRKVMNEYAEVQSSAGNAAEALKLWTFIMREGGLPDTVRTKILNSALWAAYSNALVKETVWACVQLLKTFPSTDTTHILPIQHALRCIVTGSTPPPPFAAQMSDEQVYPINAKWQQCLAEPQFFTVPCSRLQTCLQVSACFLHPDPCSIDSKVPVKVTLTLNSPFSMTFSGLRVACDVAGRRQTVDEACIFNVFRSNITLEPFTPKTFYFTVDLAESESPLQENQNMVISRVSLEMGDRSQCRVFGSLDWDGPSVSKDCYNLMDPKAMGQSSVRIVGLVGGIVNTGENTADCLLAEVGSVKLRLKNETNRTVEKLKLEFKRAQQSPDASSSFLFLDGDNELRSGMSAIVAEQLTTGEEVDYELRYSAQLLGNIELLLESSFVVTGETEVRKGRIPIMVTSGEPFTVRSQVLTTNGIPVTNVLNRNTHLLKVDLKSNANIEITQIEWLMADVVANASSLSSGTPLVEPDQLSNGDVISYCTPIDIASEEEGDGVEKPLGRLAVQWHRSTSLFPVRSIVPLCRTPIAPCPVGVFVEVAESRAEMRRPIHVTYTLVSHSKEVMDMNASFDLTDTFMFSGDKQHSFKLLPGAHHQINVVVMALAAGRLSFPRVTLRSPQVSDAVLLDSLRSLPATIFVLPLSKDSIGAMSAA